MRRYFLPPMLKITRLSAMKSALPNITLISAGPAQEGVAHLSKPKPERRSGLWVAFPQKPDGPLGDYLHGSV
jgi:hypothetical protein